MKCDTSTERPKNPDGTNFYEDTKHLIEANKNGKLIPERWRVSRREHANPLLQSGMHLTQLAVEAKLGNAESFKIIELALTTIDSLYKFKNDPVFGGYILRYDPITCDEWFEYPKENQPYVCCKFLPNLNPGNFNKENQYIYSTPDNDSIVEGTKPKTIVFEADDAAHDDGNPQHYHFHAHDGNPGRFRLWEPSFDEITGLLGGYFMLWYCLKDKTSIQAVNIVNEVKTQSDRLGIYLKETSYLLVRPNKGFTYYGCTGIGSMLEMICSRVFARINDKPMDYYKSNHSFEDALKLAGVWTDFNTLIAANVSPGSEFPLRANLITDQLYTLVAPLMGTFNAMLSRMLGISLDTLQNFSNAERLVLELDDIKINTLYVLANYKVFNVGAFGGRDEIQFPDDPRFEFAIGYLIKRLMLIDPRAVLLAYYQLPFGFKPWVGLFSLGDNEDPFYRDCYLNWFHALPEKPNENEITDDDITNQGFLTAVAYLLEENEANKTKLDAQLARMFETLTSDYNSDLFVNDDEGISIENLENKSFYYGFSLPLSLKWLHDSNQNVGCLGLFLPSFLRPNNLPTIASMSRWPKSILPKEAIRSLSDFTPIDGNNYEGPPLEFLPLNYTRIGMSTNYFRPGGGNHPFIDIDLFENPVPVPTLSQVSVMPPPVSEKHDILEYHIDTSQTAELIEAELLATIPLGGFRVVQHTFHPPAFPSNLPQALYILDARLEIYDEKGSSVNPKPLVRSDDGSITITLILKSYADWIEVPILGRIAPDTSHLTNAYFRGSFYFGWIFNASYNA
jgi:hypothetical protein